MAKEKLRKTKLILLKDVATRKADAGMDEKAGRRKARLAKREKNKNER